MQVCVLYACAGKDDSKVKAIADAIAKSIERQGSSSTVVYNMSTDTDKRLTLFDYLVFVSEPISFFSSKIPSYIQKYIENAGQVSGKRAACVITGKSMFQSKALMNLMKITEGQGIILKTSDIINKTGDATAFGAHLNVERNY